MHHTEVMVDLETMSTKPNAAVLSIGAVAIIFTEPSIQFREFYQTINFEEAKEYNLDIDPGTVKFWMEQEREAQNALFINPQTLKTTLSLFNNWFETLPNVQGVWGNGAAFDNVILDNLYQTAKMKRPWSHRQDRCFRTIKAIYKDVVAAPENVGVAHNALDDAKWQAFYLVDILNYIIGKNS